MSNHDTDVRTILYIAAISCSHEIDRDKIVLYRDEKNNDVALAQLADRLYEAHTKAITQLQKRIAELEAARMAYASEFPLNADGEPDVGNIHANIRRLKVERDAAVIKGLEMAAKACEARIGTGEPGIEAPECDQEAMDCAADIRALASQLNGEKK